MDENSKFFPPFEHWNGRFNRETFSGREIDEVFSRFQANFRHFASLLKIKMGPAEKGIRNGIIFVMCREMVRHEKEKTQLRPKAADLYRLMDKREIVAARCAGLVAGSIFFHENPDTLESLREYDEKQAAIRKQEREEKRLAKLQKSLEKPPNYRKKPNRQSHRNQSVARQRNVAPVPDAPVDSAIRKPMKFMGGERSRPCPGFYHPDFLHS